MQKNLDSTIMEPQNHPAINAAYLQIQFPTLFAVVIASTKAAFKDVYVRSIVRRPIGRLFKRVHRTHDS